MDRARINEGARPCDLRTGWAAMREANRVRRRRLRCRVSAAGQCTGRRSIPTKKPLPTLASDADAEAFVDQANLAGFDLSAMAPTRFEFGPTASRINMRLPTPLLEAVRAMARSQGVPCHWIVNCRLAETEMPPTAYWIAQIVFVSAFLAQLSQTSLELLAVFAVAQFLLVGARLWNAGRRPWLALTPPALTVGCWVVSMQWAVRSSSGGDGAGLLAAMLSMAVCCASYLATAIVAGCLAPRVTRRQGLIRLHGTDANGEPGSTPWS